jgi:hypothetical protein
MKELTVSIPTSIDEVIDSLLARQVDGISVAAPEIGDNHAWLDDRLENIPVPVVPVNGAPKGRFQRCNG